MPLHSYADVQAIPSKRMWQLLRTLRHSPPGRATRGERRETFDAAMEQAEQLILAAQTVGTATRPLLLFYGVSQLGRAIAATSTALDNKQYRLSGHGLTDGPLSVVASSGLSAVTIRSDPTGSFPTVSLALDASSMSDDVRLGDLWGLIPDGDRFPLPGMSDRRALVVELPSGMIMRMPEQMQCEVHPVPPEVFGGREASIELMRLLSQPTVDKSVITTQHEQVQQFLSGYPGVSNAYSTSRQTQPIHFKWTDGGKAIRLPLYLPKDPNKSELDSLLPERAHVYHGVLRTYPALDAGHRPAHPFMVWWAVLYVLSRLARYEPRYWAKLISVSGSSDAVAIEYLLDEAQSAIPELAYSAIDQVAS